jgi:DNA primase
MPGIDFREAGARLRLADVLDLVGFVPRTRRGDQLRGPCPVHRSHSPASRSFAADLGKQRWHCFRCGAGGNALELWATATRPPLHAAVLDLCARLGRDVPWLSRRPAPAATRPRYAHDPENNLMPDP